MENKTLVLLLLVPFLLTSRVVVVPTVSLASWFVWGIDDVLTHFVLESSFFLIYDLKCLLFDLNEYLQPSEFIEAKQVEELQASEYDFEKVLAAVDEPLVVRGLFSSAVALEKWRDLAYLNNTVGHLGCPVAMKNHDHFEVERDSMTYREIFDDLVKEKRGREGEGEKEKEKGNESQASTVYVSGDQFIFTQKAGEKLLEDLQLEKFLGRKYMDSPLYSKEDLYLFIGRRGRSGTSWHCAPNRSMFLLILGRKRWTFIHARYSVLLRPQRSHLYSRIFLAFQSFRNFLTQEEKNEGRSENTVEEDGTLFQHVPRSVVTLKPGDVLFVPSWYWHHVENIPDEEKKGGEEKEKKEKKGGGVGGEEEIEGMTIGVDVDTHVWNHAWAKALFPPL